MFTSETRDDNDSKNCNRYPNNTHNRNNTRSKVFNVLILLLLHENFIVVLHMSKVLLVPFFSLLLSIFAFKFLSRINARKALVLRNNKNKEEKRDEYQQQQH